MAVELMQSKCIIQDSLSDWVIESGTMARVYKYALCNISATSAKDDSEGCFLPRVPGSPPLPRFQLTLPSSDGAHLPQDYDFDLLLPGSMIEEVTNGAVNARGWVLQEVSRTINDLAATKHISNIISRESWPHE